MMTFVTEQKLRQLDAADFPINPQVETGRLQKCRQPKNDLQKGIGKQTTKKSSVFPKPDIPTSYPPLMAPIRVLSAVVAR
jgi:hypothetical protein